MKNFKFKISEDDTFDSISKAVSDEALEMARDEMADRITDSPQITTADYRKGAQTLDLGKTEKTPSGKNPYDMYGKVGNNGVIKTSRVTPERSHYVHEIYRDGSESLSEKDDFVKKINSQSVNRDDLSELGRIVRTTSKNADAYASWESRSNNAYKAFDADKYTIEETAARRGLPASLLSSVYFKSLADEGSLNDAAPSVRHAKMAYKRLYGQPLSWDDETISEYLKTPEGILDFIAIGLRSEAKYLGYNTETLTKNQINDLLTGYGKWSEKDTDFNNSVMAYTSVFDNIYKKLPSKDYEVKLV